MESSVLWGSSPGSKYWWAFLAQRWSYTAVRFPVIMIKIIAACVCMLHSADQLCGSMITFKVDSASLLAVLAGAEGGEGRKFRSFTESCWWNQILEYWRQNQMIIAGHLNKELRNLLHTESPPHSPPEPLLWGNNRTTVPLTLWIWKWVHALRV